MKAVAVYGDVLGRAHVAEHEAAVVGNPATHRLRFAREDTVGAETLHAIIVHVDDVQRVIRIHIHMRDHVELARRAA